MNLKKLLLTVLPRTNHGYTISKNSLGKHAKRISLNLFSLLKARLDLALYNVQEAIRDVIAFIAFRLVGTKW